MWNMSKATKFWQQKKSYRRIDVTDEAVVNEFNCIEQVYMRLISGPIRIKLKKLVSGQIVYF